MARIGTFAGATGAYGLPLSFVHPADNDFAKARFSPILLDPRLKLTNKQRRRLQGEIDDLAGLGRLAREKSLDQITRKAAKRSKRNKKQHKGQHHPKKHHKKQPGRRFRL